METQNTIPQPATDYLARLVDARKRAYAADCVTRWESGQPFAPSWPNLKAEYVDDIARKLGRYLSPKGSKPVSAPSPVEEWVAEVVEPAAKPVRKPRISAGKEVAIAPTIEYKLGIRNLADDLNGKPVPATAARSRFIEGTYGDRGSYRINPNGRWAQAALKTIAEYETKAAFRWPRQKSKDVSLAGTTAVKPLFTETLGGRKWLDVVAEMQGPAYRGWQPGDSTPDAVRSFPTMNIARLTSYAEAAG